MAFVDDVLRKTASDPNADYKKQAEQIVTQIKRGALQAQQNNRREYSNKVSSTGKPAFADDYCDGGYGNIFSSRRDAERVSHFVAAMLAQEGFTLNAVEAKRHFSYAAAHSILGYHWYKTYHRGAYGIHVSVCW